MSRINVRDMQRVPHVHVFGDRINGRDVCDSCPFRAKRHRIISAFGNDTVTIRLEDKSFDQKFVTALTLQGLTVPELKGNLLKQNPNIKGISKMRKPELVSALLELVK